MRPPLSVIVVASLAAPLAAGGAAREIPDIATLEALKRQQPHQLPGDWEVRLGLSDGGEAAGPWKLLYCHAKYLGKGEPPRFRRKGAPYAEFLGPVLFTTEEKASVLEQADGEWCVPAEGLFCGLVLCAWEGAYVVRVVSVESKPLAQRRIEVTKPAACYWHEFAREPRSAPRNDAFAAHPDYDGLASIWPLAGRVVGMPAPEGGTPLPGRIPLGEPWGELFGGDIRRARAIGEESHPLELSIERGAFVIRGGMKMLAWPELHLLARWWVNGKAVVAPRTQQPRMISIGREVTYAKEMRVAAGWPDHLGELKAGDKVGLQVLYSPAMARQIPPKNMFARALGALGRQEPGAAPVPLLSNRIEFTVTDDLLRARAAQQKAE